MLIFALLILALPTSAGPRSVKYALLDARAVKAAKAAQSAAPARSVNTTLPAHLTLVDAPPPALRAFLTPATNVPQMLTLTAPETLRLFWIESGNGSGIPALFHDQEYYRASSSKGQVTGLWDVTAGIHADVRLGDLIFDHEQASLRLIPIHTTSTKTPGGVQPGFVIGFGTTW